MKGEAATDAGGLQVGQKARTASLHGSASSWMISKEGDGSTSTAKQSIEDSICTGQAGKPSCIEMIESLFGACKGNVCQHPSKRVH